MAVDLQLIADVDFALTEYLKPAISFLFIVLFNGFVELYSVDDYCQAECVCSGWFAGVLLWLGLFDLQLRAE